MSAESISLKYKVELVVQRNRKRGKRGAVWWVVRIVHFRDMLFSNAYKVTILYYILKSLLKGGNPCYAFAPVEKEKTQSNAYVDLLSLYLFCVPIAELEDEGFLISDWQATACEANLVCHFFVNSIIFIVTEPYTLVYILSMVTYEKGLCSNNRYQMSHKPKLFIIQTFAKK